MGEVGQSQPRSVLMMTNVLLPDESSSDGALAGKIYNARDLSNVPLDCWRRGRSDVSV